MKKEILVTGGTGFIGSHTVVELHSAGYQPVIVDNLSNSKRDAIENIAQIIKETPIFYEVDCSDKNAMSKVFSRHNFVAVIHFAASKAVGESVKKPLLYYRNNIASLITLLECMQSNDTEALVFSSSCTVYGQPSILPVTEESPILAATSPYGNTKQINEQIIYDFVASGQPIKAILLRYFNPIGAHPSALLGEAPHGVPQNLVPFLTQSVAGIRKELAVFGTDYNTPDGSCMRDYIDICDLAKAHIAALDHLLKKEYPTQSVKPFNIGTGKGVSVLELINTFESANNIKVPYYVTKRRDGDVEAIWADARKAEKELGWHSNTPLEETLRNAWNWQKELLKKSNTRK